MIDFIKYLISKKDTKGFLNKLLKKTLILLVLIGGPLFAVNQFGERSFGLFHLFTSSSEVHYWSIGAASSLMLIWFFFLRKMDLFEKERIHHLIIIFIVSIGSMYLLYPLRILLFEYLQFTVPRNGYGDFIYCVVGIGLLEEIVKIIPVLLFLKFSKAINEPFDYILYASVAALGFSYIENIQYFDHGLTNITTRGIFCCIGHMALSSIVAYGLMLAKYRGYNKFILFGGFLFIAALLHGIYDFVLISYYAYEYVFIANFIVLFLIHLWIYFMNNTLNMSPFYTDKIKFNSRNLQFLGLVVCIVVLMTGYVAIGFTRDSYMAEDYLLDRLYSLSFFIALFLFSIKNITLIKGYLALFRLPFRNISKRHLKSDASGRSIQLTPSDKYSIDSDLVNKQDLMQEAILENRWIVDERLNSYLVSLSNELQTEKYCNDKILVMPVWDEKHFSEDRMIVVRIYLIKDESLIGTSFTESKKYRLVGKVYANLIPNLQTEIALVSD